jgi:hypothetical protein
VLAGRRSRKCSGDPIGKAAGPSIRANADGSDKMCPVDTPPPGWSPPGGPPPLNGDPPYGYPPYGYPPYGTPPPALRLGCVPLRPLSVTDILDGSFRVVRRNPRATLGLAAIIAVIQAVCLVLFQLALYNSDGQPNDVSATGDQFSTGVTSSGPPVAQLSAVFSVIVLSSLLGSILAGMLTAVVTEDVLGVRITLGQAWDRARRRIWALVGLSVVTTVLEVLGLIPFLTVGIWLWGIWAVAVPAMMVEGTGIRRSLGRSKQLVHAMFWRVWGIRALGTLLVVVISGVITVPFQVAGIVIDGTSIEPGTIPVTLIVLSAIGSILSITVTAPVRAAIDSLLYVDLRMRKEGLDLVLQQRVAPGATGAPPRW